MLFRQFLYFFFMIILWLMIDGKICAHELELRTDCTD